MKSTSLSPLRENFPSQFSAGQALIRPLVLISSLQVGGAETVTVSFLRHLASEGFDAVACTVTSKHDGAPASELNAAGMARHDLGARRLADPAAFLRLIRLIQREKPSIIHAHGQDASILAAAARLLNSVPLIITRHVLDEPTRNWREQMRARLALSALHHADAVVAVSSAAADRLAELSRIPRPSIRVIRNGIDTEKFARTETMADKAGLRQELGIRPGEPAILVPAVLREGKGHEVLLQAVPTILSRFPSVRILFSGSGEQEKMLRQLAAPFGNTVLFLGFRDDIPNLLSLCDFVVLPSFAEALPTVLLEAAASGRAVVATNVSGIKEVVEHSRTGLLVSPRDFSSLADAILFLLSNPDVSKNYGTNARQLAEANFGMDLQVRRTMALWSEVIAGGRS